jgi:hypothetical protein
MTLWGLLSLSLPRLTHVQIQDVILDVVVSSVFNLFCFPFIF